jgi:hypothetical protein
MLMCACLWPSKQWPTGIASVHRMSAFSDDMLMTLTPYLLSWGRNTAKELTLEELLTLPPNLADRHRQCIRAVAIKMLAEEPTTQKLASLVASKMTAFHHDFHPSQSVRSKLSCPVSLNNHQQCACLMQSIWDRPMPYRPFVDALNETIHADMRMYLTYDCS